AEIPSDPTSESTAISRQLHHSHGHDLHCKTYPSLNSRNSCVADGIAIAQHFIIADAIFDRWWLSIE
ncbi:hypothetical protein, partial [Rhizobium acidisoli]|uniref:hypothetical protein n=1 Tax=Rhizobium acidisoli TaxID=1538158 RepID=UPI0006CC29B3